MNVVRIVRDIIKEVEENRIDSTTDLLRALFGKNDGALNWLLKASSKFKKGGFYLNMGVLADKYRKLKIDSMIDTFTETKKEVYSEIKKDLDKLAEIAGDLDPNLEANFKLKTELAKHELGRDIDIRDAAFVTGLIAQPFTGFALLALVIRDAIATYKIKTKNKDALAKIKKFEEQYKKFKTNYEEEMGKNQWKANAAKLKVFFAACKEKASNYIKDKEKDNKTFLGKFSKHFNKNKVLDELKMRFCKILKDLDEDMSRFVKSSQ
ncbi:MAG: hypothetical protein FWC41_03525 [Firmicutes bacterium]|nr:hypothetical protein [Bacillota bacterium]